MAVEFQNNRVMFTEFVGVEEAEGLLNWLQKNPGARVDLSLCLHLHPANVQVLMAAKTPVATWPHDSELRFWLESVLNRED